MTDQRNSARKDPVAFMVGNGFDFSGLPEVMHGGYARWWCFGISAGSFLQAVIENNLVNAVAKADSVNLARLRDISLWIHNNGDDRSTGENASSWGEIGGYFGRLEKAMRANL